MKLIEMVSQDFMAAYKNREMEKKDFLGLVKSELTKETKTPEDDYVVAKIKSMIKAAEATNSLSEMELNILGKYLPKQLSDVELEGIITKFTSESNLTQKDIGKVMGFLKSNYGGQYDGKLASTITKKILS